MTKRGCPIESLAKDREVGRAVNVLIRAKSLMMIEAYWPLGLELLKKEGLDDDRLLVDVEQRFRKYQEHLREQEKQGGDSQKQIKGKTWESLAATRTT